MSWRAFSVMFVWNNERKTFKSPNKRVDVNGIPSFSHCLYILPTPTISDPFFLTWSVLFVTPCSTFHCYDKTTLFTYLHIVIMLLLYLEELRDIKIALETIVLWKWNRMAPVSLGDSHAPTVLYKLCCQWVNSWALLLTSTVVWCAPDRAGL